MKRLGRPTKHEFTRELLYQITNYTLDGLTYKAMAPLLGVPVERIYYWSKTFPVLKQWVLEAKEDRVYWRLENLLAERMKIADQLSESLKK